MHTYPRIRPLTRVPVALLLGAALAACSDTPAATGPLTASIADSALQQARVSAELDAFVAVQGTYCDDFALPCDPDPRYNDIGYILSQWEYVGGPFVTLDPFGVNARWYAKPTHFGPVFPAFDYDGSVSERQLPDGRRRIVVHIRSRNTFAALYDEQGNTVLGADFFEYDFETPLLAQESASAELILPAGFVGQPDLAQVIFAPAPGLELLKFTVHVRFEGTLRRDFRGIPAGTEVSAVLLSTWLGKHIDKATGQRIGQVIGDYAPGTTINVKPIRK